MREAVQNSHRDVLELKESAKWELTDAEKELKWLRGAFASSEKEYEQNQRNMSELKKWLCLELFSRCPVFHIFLAEMDGSSLFFTILVVLDIKLWLFDILCDNSRMNTGLPKSTGIHTLQPHVAASQHVNAATDSSNASQHQQQQQCSAAAASTQHKENSSHQEGVFETQSLSGSFTTIPKLPRSCLRFSGHFKGWGTNEKLIISILVHINAKQRKLIRETYAGIYGEDLLKAFQEELSSDFERSVLLWTLDPAERDAYLANEATKKWTASNQVLLEIACTRSPHDLLLARQAYHARFKRSLEEDVAAHTTRDFQKRKVQSNPSSLPLVHVSSNNFNH